MLITIEYISLISLCGICFQKRRRRARRGETKALESFLVGICRLHGDLLGHPVGPFEYGLF